MEDLERICHNLNDFMDMLNNEIKLPDGYIFKDENGNVINATKIVLEKKEKEYPKTYEECCKVLGYNQVMPKDHILGYMGTLLSNFQQLLICRDAYWKIAGEEMELGKSWEPDYNDFNKTSSMYCLCGKFGLSVINPLQFVFPSKEMRDEFAENFKKDIDSCK